MRVNERVQEEDKSKYALYIISQIPHLTCIINRTTGHDQHATNGTQTQKNQKDPKREPSLDGDHKRVER